MRKLGEMVNRLVIAAVLLVAAAAFLVGREAVGRHYDYREMTAPRTLHQLSLETRQGPDERDGTLLAGGGLFAMGLLAFGGMLFAMSSGREFGRGMARKRRRSRAAARPSELPVMRSLPRAPILPALPPPEEGRYEDA